MITVRMLGGARKSFPAGEVTLDVSKITVLELFDVLDGCKPPETPPMDTENVLVAINGADSSVSGGKYATIQDGDRVDIIPVIHGGAPCLQFDVGDMRVAALCVPSNMADPVQLRQRFADMHIQAVNANHILGKSHLQRILEITVEAKRRDVMLSERLEIDIMLRLAGTTQIARAISQVGVAPDKDAVVVALGKHKNPSMLCDALSDVALSFPEMTKETPACFDYITIPPDRTLEDMLVERAAVL